MGLPARRRGRRRADRPPDARARTTAYPRSSRPSATCRPPPVRRADDYDVVELYSCFPSMPKLTRRALGRAAAASRLGDRRPLVLRRAGQQLPDARARDDGRAAPGRTAAPASSTASGCSTPSTTRSCWPTTRGPTAGIPHRRAPSATRARRSTPVPVTEDYTGRRSMLTYSVMFGRDGSARTRRGDRCGRARRTGRGGESTADGDTLAELTSGAEPVGRVRHGHGRRPFPPSPLRATVPRTQRRRNGEPRQVLHRW